jgi:hypothetical protein
MRPKNFLIAALPLAILALAGCGGGGGDSTESVPPATIATPAALSKEELITQGDAICAEVNAAVGSLASSNAEAPSQATQVSDLYIGMVESIKDLGTPDEPVGYSEFIEAAEGLSQVEGEAKLAAEREDTAALGEAEASAAQALGAFEAAAGEYGFENCSEGPRAPSTSGAAPSEEEGGVEVAPEAGEEAEVEEAAPEEAAPETGGAGGGVEEAAPEGGGSGGGSSGGVGPG